MDSIPEYSPITVLPQPVYIFLPIPMPQPLRVFMLLPINTLPGGEPHGCIIALGIILLPIHTPSHISLDIFLPIQIRALTGLLGVRVGIMFEPSITEVVSLVDREL